MSVLAVTFDVDGTLWDTRQLVREALNRILTALVDMAPSENTLSLTLDHLEAIRAEVADEFPASATSSTEGLELIRTHSFIRVLESLGYANPQRGGEELASLYFEHRWNPRDLYTDVLPTLESLLGSFVLGVITDGRSRLDKAGISRFFNFIVYAGDHGVEKPGRFLFEVACKHAACDVSRLAHVGDSLKHDVAGAKGVGARAIWINRDNRPNDELVQPDAEIHSLLELLPLLHSS